MSQLPLELRPMVDELARQQDLPPNAASEIELAIISSPQLTARMVKAAREGTLQHLRLSLPRSNEGGHYNVDEIALYVSADTFSLYSAKSDQNIRLDILTATMGHEVEHALQVKENRDATNMLAYGIEDQIRKAGPGGQADLTATFDMYLHTMRKHEADAEMAGWDALASRVQTQSHGPVDRKNFLERAAFTTLCVEIKDDAYIPTRGIVLEDNMQMLEKHLPKSGPFNREPVAQCHFDQPANEAKLGAQGKSDYINYYGTLGLEEAARIVQKWQDPPTILLDMDKLGFKKDLLESNGLDMGGEGRSLAVTDISHGQAKWVSLHHSKASGQKHGTPDLEPDAPRMAQVLPSHSDHPDHALYQGISEKMHDEYTRHGRLPQEGELERITTSLVVAARQQGATRADHVLFSNHSGTGEVGRNIFVVQGDLRDPAHNRVHVAREMAANTPVEQSSRQLDLFNQQQTQELTRQSLEQQQAPQQEPHRQVLAR